MKFEEIMPNLIRGEVVHVVIGAIVTEYYLRSDYRLGYRRFDRGRKLRGASSSLSWEEVITGDWNVGKRRKKM